jgi:lipoate-protein ligase A
MSIDAALLDRADRDGVSTLRLYGWSPACLSFGRNEPALSRYDRAAIERLGLAVVRRPTGGRAVWHEHEVTYALAAPIAMFGSLKAAYCAIHQRIADALGALGADATLAPDRRAAGGASLSAGACFASPVGGEVLIGGRKVVGSAQVRQGDAFLQHGSILLAGSQERVNQISRRPSAGASHASITLSEALGRDVTFGHVAAAVAAAFDSAPQRSGQEREQVFPLLPSLFSDPSWTWRR